MVSDKNEILDEILDTFGKHIGETWQIKVKKSDGSLSEIKLIEALKTGIVDNISFAKLPNNHITNLIVNIEEKKYPTIIETTAEEIIYNGELEFNANFKLIIAQTKKIDDARAILGFLIVYPYGNRTTIVFNEDLSIPGTLDEKSRVNGLGFIDVHIVADNMANDNEMMRIVPIDISRMRKRKFWLQVVDNFILKPEYFENVLIIDCKKELIKRTKTPKDYTKYYPKTVIITNFDKVKDSGMHITPSGDKLEIKIEHVDKNELQEEVNKYLKKGYEVSNQQQAVGGYVIFLKKK